MWEERQRRVDCWYNNLQQPLVRTAFGFDTMDDWLDIVINQMKANQPPFCDDWEHWKAPAQGKIPELPLDWDFID